MTKKHFVEIAKIFKQVRATKEVAQICIKLCVVFKQLNPRFNEQKFLEASGF